MGEERNDETSILSGEMPCQRCPSLSHFKKFQEAVEKLFPSANTFSVCYNWKIR